MAANTCPAPDQREFVAAKTEHFDRVWGRVRDIASNLIASGETSLSRVLRLTEAAWREVDIAAAQGTAYGGPVTLPRAALVGGRQHLHARTLIGHAEPETTSVVELGSGWGLNLLDLYLAGGPKHARYRGLELSSSGRACGAMLAALEPDLDAAFLPFNYLEPDYSVLEPEQIPHLSSEAIAGLFSLGERVTGIHFEPVGWQMRRDRDMPEAERGATEENAERFNYNRNFWPILRDFERAGELEILHAEPDILGHKTKNASSLVVWRRG